jgi:hypothetical protein
MTKRKTAGNGVLAELASNLMTVAAKLLWQLWMMSCTDGRGNLVCAGNG